MKTSAILKNGMKLLWASRLRTLLMMLGMIIGTAAFLASTSFGEGSRKDFMDKIERQFGGASIFLVSAKASKSGANIPTNSLTLADLKEISDKVESVVAYDPVQSLAGVEIVHKGIVEESNVMGSLADVPLVWNRGIIEGEMFTEFDVESSARVAIIGHQISSLLFSNQNPIGQTIRVNNVPFEVMGILDSVGVDPHGLNRDMDVVIPVSTLMSRLMNIDRVHAAKFLIDDVTNLDAVMSDMTSILRERHNLNDDNPDDFRLITPVDVKRMVAQMNSTFTVLLPSIAFISMIVGGIVIAAIMLMNIKERRMEIGLRKAIGARNKDIFVQFLIEIAVISGLGSVFGILIAFVIAEFGSAYGIPTYISMRSLSMAFVLPLMVGLIAGLVPSNKASKLDPVENLAA